MGIPAPVIVAEQVAHTALGGSNSGICGDPSHTYGFHLAANEVGPSDYSRWRDPNGSDGPYVNWSYCCAGDFRHGGNTILRAKHRDVLARLMRGELPMICEFIGKPWADQPVYYWARWNGVETLQRYNGAGHDLWSHISWYRSKVDQPAHLWTTPPSMQENEMFRLKGSNGTFLVTGTVSIVGKPIALGPLSAAANADFDAAGFELRTVNYVNPEFYTGHPLGGNLPSLSAADLAEIRKVIAAELAKLTVPPAQIDDATIDKIASTTLAAMPLHVRSRPEAVKVSYEGSNLAEDS